MQKIQEMARRQYSMVKKNTQGLCVCVYTRTNKQLSACWGYSAKIDRLVQVFSIMFHREKYLAKTSVAGLFNK